MGDDCADSTLQPLPRDALLGEIASDAAAARSTTTATKAFRELDADARRRRDKASEMAMKRQMANQKMWIDEQRKREEQQREEQVTQHPLANAFLAGRRFHTNANGAAR